MNTLVVRKAHCKSLLIALSVIYSEDKTAASSEQKNAQECACSVIKRGKHNK
jgi:hypothetical protein